MISLIGPGAVGGLLAALIARSGQKVTVVARPATAARIAERGIRVESEQFGSFSANPSVQSIPVMNAPALITVKQYGLANILPDLAWAKPHEVLSLLNGLVHAPLIHASFGTATPRTANGSIGVLVVRRPDGVIAHESGFITVNVPASAADWRLVAVLREAGVDVNAKGTEDEVLWHKLRFLAPMALLTAWTDEPLGKALAHDPDTTNALIEEVAAVATAEGVPTNAAKLRDSLYDTRPDAKSSLALDVRRGGPAELNALGEDIIYRAGLHHIAVPTFERLVATIGARVSSR
ncbi:MAG TPA: 2-dehydropantoate 2-reductase N-terminal domain-containing protein [Actinomycetaceae bacterium]|nr:2-dehydropantoate 2-reductase N-terminal domain-containing protein [Actinomycetaceae bacterium]